MREIDINDFYTDININKMTQFYHANQNTKEWERWDPIPIFLIEETNSLTCFLINHCLYNNFQHTFIILVIFSEYFTWLFNGSLWVRYPSLRTHYYFWKRGALAVKSHQTSNKHETNFFIKRKLKQKKVEKKKGPLLLLYKFWKKEIRLFSKIFLFTFCCSLPKLGNNITKCYFWDFCEEELTLYNWKEDFKVLQ